MVLKVTNAGTRQPENLEDAQSPAIKENNVLADPTDNTADNIGSSEFDEGGTSQQDNVENPTESSQEMRNLGNNDRYLSAYMAQRSVASSSSRKMEEIFNDGIGDDSAEVQAEESKREAAKTEFSDKVMGMIKEAPEAVSEDVEKANFARAAAGAVLDTAQNVTNFMIDGANFVEGFIGLDMIPDDGHVDFADSLIPPSDSNTENFARSLMEFFGAFGALTKGAKVVNAAGKIQQFAKAGVIGAAADIIVTDPEDNLISEFAKKAGISTQLTDYLAAEAKDASRFEKRLLAAAEGVMLGLGAETASYLAGGLVKVVKAVKAKKSHVEAVEALGKAELVEEAGEAVAKADLPPIPEAPVRELKLPPRISDLPPIPEDEAFQIVKEIKGEVDVAGDLSEVMNVDLLRYDGKGDPDTIVKAVGDRIKGNVELQKRGVRHVTQTLDKARALADDPKFLEKLQATKKATAANAEEIAASGLIVQRANRSLQELAQKAVDGEVSDYAVIQAVQNYADVFTKFTGIAAESGRATNIMQHIETDPKLLTKSMDQIEKIFGGEADTKSIIAKLANMDNDAIDEVVQRSMYSNIKNAVEEVAINGMLSSFKTAMVNVANIVPTVGYPTELALQGKISKMAKRGKFVESMETVTRFDEKLGKEVKIKVPKKVDGETQMELDGTLEGEAAYAYKGLMESLRGVFGIAWQSIKTGKDASMVGTGSKYSANFAPAITAENFGGGKVVDVLGSMIRIPTERMLGPGDSIFKYANRMSELNRQGYVEARKRGINAPEEIEIFVNNFAHLPPASASLQADSFASSQVFAGDMGERSQQLYDTMDKVVPFRKIWAPFLKTGLNVNAETVKRNPLIAAFLPEIHTAIKKGGRDADAAIAKMAVGGGAMTLMFGLVTQGTVTGARPQNKQAAAVWDLAGRKEYTVTIPGTDISIGYSRFDPMGRLLGFVADLTSVASNAMENDENTQQVVQDLLMGSFAAVSQAVSPDHIVGTVSDLTEAISSGDPSRLRSTLAQLPTRFIPFSGLLRQVRRATDVKRDTRSFSEAGWNNPFTAFADESINHMMNTIPGLSKHLPTHKNMFYKTSVPASGIAAEFASPLNINRERHDVVTSELLELGMSSAKYDLTRSNPLDKGIRVGKVRPTITKGGATIHLNAEEYDQLQKFAAGIDVPGQPTLEEALRREIEGNYPTPRKESGLTITDAVKRTVLSGIIRQYQTNAVNLLGASNSEVFRRLKEKQEKNLKDFGAQNVQ